jgi:copper transport protein
MRRYPTHLRRGLILVAVAGVVLLGSTGTASAHAQLEGSDPPAGVVLATAPQRVTLRFDEPVEIAAGAIQVFDDHFNRVDSGPVKRLNDRSSQIQVAVRPGLTRGTYTVSWRVSSADTHPVSGSFRFSIGAQSQVSGKVPGAGRNDAAGLLLGVMRGVGYVGLILGPGLLLVTLGLWPAGLGIRGTRRMLYAGLTLLGLSAVGGMFLQGVWASSKPLSAIWSATSSLNTHSRRFDTLYALRFYMLIAFGGLLVASVSRHDRVAAREAAAVARSAKKGRRKQVELNPGRGRSWRDGLLLVATLVSTLALMVTWSLAGHAASGVQPVVALVADLAHLLAMVIWLGGLALLVISLRAVDRAADLARVLPRFSTVAFTAVVVLVTSGMYQAWREVGSLAALTGTTFGRVLLVKAGGVIVLMALGNLARRWVQRHLAPARLRLMAPMVTAYAMTAAVLPAPDVAPRGYGPSELRTLRRGLTAELGVAMAVLGLTAALVVAVPGRQGFVRPFTANLGAPGLQVKVKLEVPRVGDTTMHLRALEPSGQAQGITALTGSISEPARGLGPLPIRLPTAAGASPSGVEDIGLTFPTGGHWKVQFTIHTSPVDATSFAITVPVK